MAMRALVLTVLAVFFMPAAGLADQTDLRLDVLFEDLRTGNSGDADGIVDRVEAIWADAPSDTVDILYSRAVTAIDAGRVDLAGALLDHAIGLSPNFAQAYALRGAVRLRTEDENGAITDFSRAIELEPRHFEARIALAEIMLAGGDKKGAYAMLQKALEWNPHDEHARSRAGKLRDDLDGQEI